MLYLIFFILLAGFSPTGFCEDAAPKTVTTYAASDYAAYSHSPFTHTVWDPLVKEGFDAMDRQDLPTAIEFLRKAVIAGCSSPIVLFKLALAYETQGSYYSAVQYYNLAKEGFKKANQDHRYAKQFSENYGRALTMLGQTEKAIPVLEEAAADPLGSSWVLKLLGQVYLAKKDPAKAADYFGRYTAREKGTITPPELINIHLELARAFNTAGDTDNAIKHYEQVATLDPSNAESQNYLRQKKSNQSIDRFMDMINN